jgi:hypothetical protein
VQIFEIMLVGPESFISQSVRTAWRAAGLHLLGPFPIAKVDIRQARQATGVVIDISQDPDAIFELCELLEEQKISFLYALAKDAVRRDGAFVVSDAATDIEGIILALVREGDSGTRH